MCPKFIWNFKISLNFELKIDFEPRSITENYLLALKRSLGGYLNLPPSLTTQSFIQR